MLQVNGDLFKMLKTRLYFICICNAYTFLFVNKIFAYINTGSIMDITCLQQPQSPQEDNMTVRGECRAQRNSWYESSIQQLAFLHCTFTHTYTQTCMRQLAICIEAGKAQSNCGRKVVGCARPQVRQPLQVHSSQSCVVSKLRQRQRQWAASLHPFRCKSQRIGLWPSSWRILIKTFFCSNLLGALFYTQVQHVAEVFSLYFRPNICA